MTTFITRHPVGDSVTVAENSEGGRHQLPARTVLARVRYQDSGLDKTFVMTSEEIVIGRGGKAVWVDLKLEGPQDVSREHCRIRRDPRTGSFFIRDLSQLGTTVNGTPIPKSVERIESGEKVDRNREVLLPSPARVTLADVCTLEFEAESSE
jgi:hypothetical protein